MDQECHSCFPDEHICIMSILFKKKRYFPDNIHMLYEKRNLSDVIIQSTICELVTLHYRIIIMQKILIRIVY